MNIGIHKRPRIGSVLTTIYFGGVLASASTIALHQIRYDLIGATFLVGILAIYFTARSREEIVVYLDKKEDTTAISKTQTQNSQLDGIMIENSYPQHVLNEICRALGAGQGAIYVEENGELNLKYGYAFSDTRSFKMGEGLVGRVAAEKETLYIDNLPQGYVTVFSGLGNATPTRLALIPIESGVIEIATFTDISKATLKHIETSCSGILK